MLTKEEMQSAVGPMWEVTEVSATKYALKMREPDSVEEHRYALEQVREAVFGVIDELHCSTSDAAWSAAGELLDGPRLKGLQLMLEDEPDNLTCDILALALLGTAEVAEEGATFVATEALTAGVARETEKAAASTAVADPTASPELRAWRIACSMGWTEFLPTAFTLYKMGPWETDQQFYIRCKEVLARVERLFPKCNP